MLEGSDCHFWSLMDAVRQTGNCASRAQCRKRDFDVRDMEHRTRLMRIVTRRIALSELGNREIARRAGIPSQRISDLLAGRLEHFSADDLQAIRDRVESVVDDGESTPSVATATPP
ncbi:hypothetical protein GCM10023342_19160 [Modicisalibacter zincidurans]|uniref:HigA2-like helix-turn-helix domain-containing protein n=2 Tax=Oceanospirillales TaxID=135619 RepID=A0ABP9RE68_9GAMM